MHSYVWDIVAKNDVTWEINEEVLQMSKSANQTVILQTEFSKGMTLTTTNFYKELWFFIYNNYSVIDQNTLTPTNNGGFGFP